MAYPKVTIIILNFNGLKDTELCLKSLLKTKYQNFKAIVVDNGSEKNEAEILLKKFKNKKFIFIRLNRNYGFTGGNNKIFPKIKDKYIVLLNNDVEVTPNWLSILVKTMEKDGRIAVAQPKILWYKKKEYFDYAGGCGGFIDLFGYPFTRGRIFETLEKDNGQYDKMCNIFWASGAAMIIRKKTLDKIGYFNEIFFNYMEEIDLSYRIHRTGYKIVCQPKSVVYHKVASTASRNMTKKRFWEHRNNLLFISINYPLSTLLYVLPLRIILEYISFFYYLYDKKPDFALAIIQSQLSLIKNMPYIFANRFYYKNKNNSKLNNLIFSGSIVFSYFILKRRVFSSLPEFYSKEQD